MSLSHLSDALAGRYRIERELGAGGMATVHLAHDLRHDRKVALKVLRPELAAVIGAERFLQEIKTTANLQHPHILGLIDSGETEHQLWYVMPFVPGESLRDRITREKQLPVGEAVRLAIEVASALDYAHRHGVIHRDIKPENILLHDGRALVADFGIALAASKAGSRMTETGMSLGTPHYMSPEQAMGEREITARSDVYALGCVLYEMLTGAPPFSGPTAQAIVAKVLTGEPAPLRADRKSIPPHVEAAVLQALEKLPADRFATAAEFGAALGNPAFTSTHATVALPARGRSQAMTWLPWALLLAVIAVVLFERLRPGPVNAPPPIQRLDIVLPEDAEWVGDVFSIMALSPDARHLVYNGQDSSGRRRLYLRPMDQTRPIPIPGGENAIHPFFSPDGRWIGFSANNRLVKTPVAGGRPETICETGRAVTGTWLESGVVVFDDTSGLRQCSTAGEVTILLPNDSTGRFLFPHGLPHDRGVLFSVQRDSTTRLAVLDLQTRKVKWLDISGTDPQFVSTGHLVYVSSDGVVRAVPFDSNALTVRGEPVVLDVGVGVELGAAKMALSRTGMIVADPVEVSERALDLVDRSGRAERLSTRLGEFFDPRFSPDGRRIAVGLGGDIWIAERAQKSLTRLTLDSAATRPAWSPDGRRVAYVRQVGRRVELRVIRVDGGAPPESMPTIPGAEPWEVLFTGEGRSVVVRTVGGPGNRDIWLVALDSARPPVPLLRSPANEVAPALSPDGRWLAYVSNESGRAEVYARSFPDIGERVTVSLDGGTEPMWSPRGGELFYRSGSTLIAAQTRTGPAFEVLRRTPLFTNRDYAVDLTHQVYDVSPDGQHFVMIKNLGGARRLSVILHAFENLGVGGSATPGAR